MITLPRRGNRRRQPLLKQHPVRQPGQRIMPGHERQRRIGAPAFRDLLMRHDPPTARQRPVMHRDRPPVGQFVGDVERLRRRGQFLAPSHVIRHRHLRETAPGPAMVNEIQHQRPGPHLIRRQMIQVSIPAIAHQ